MQPALNESEGKAQLVKSARIWSMNLGSGIPQSSGSTVMLSSLVACCACGWSVAVQQNTKGVLTHDSAHRGLTAVPDREQGPMEF